MSHSYGYLVALLVGGCATDPDCASGGKCGTFDYEYQETCAPAPVSTFDPSTLPVEFEVRVSDWEAMQGTWSIELDCETLSAPTAVTLTIVDAGDELLAYTTADHPEYACNPFGQARATVTLTFDGVAEEPVVADVWLAQEQASFSLQLDGYSLDLVRVGADWFKAGFNSDASTAELPSGATFSEYCGDEALTAI